MDITYMPDPLTRAGHFVVQGVTYDWDPKGEGSLDFKLGDSKVVLRVLPIEHNGFFGTSKWPGLQVWVDEVFIGCYEITHRIEPRNLRDAVEGALLAWATQADATKKAALAKIGWLPKLG